MGRPRATSLAAVVLLLLSACSQAVRETQLYDALGIDPGADEATIKKAYRRQAL